MLAMATYVESLKNKVFPPPATVMQPAAPVQKHARSDLSLEDLGLSIDDLKATASLTPVLNEEVQNLSEEAIMNNNPNFDFSEKSIKMLKAGLIRLPEQIENYKVKIDIWESQLKDFTALMPAIKCILVLRNKGRERRSLSSLSYTPSPPPAQSPLLSDVHAIKKRRIEFIPFSDHDENDAPDNLFHYEHLLHNNNDVYSDDHSNNHSNKLNNSNNHSISYDNKSYDNSNNHSNNHSISHSNNHSNHSNNNSLNSPSPTIYPSIRDTRTL